MGRTTGKIYKVPLIMQLHSGENGTAALAMILAYYKKYVSMESVRTECLASRSNTSVKQMAKAGEHFGLSCDIMNGPTLKELKEKNGPVVMRDGRFYDIVCGFKGGKVYLISPSMGKYAITEESFQTKLSGTFLYFSPSEDFVPEGKPESFLSPIKKRFHENRKSCIYLFILYLLSAAAIVGMLFLSRRMMDDCLTGNDPEKAPILLAAMIVIVVINTVTAIITPLAVFRYGKEMSARSNSALYKKMLSLPMHFFETHIIGDIIDRTSENIVLDKKFLSSILPKLADLILVFAFLVILFFFNPTVSVICIVIEVLFMIASTAVIKRMGVINKSLSVMRSALSTNTLNGINLIETIKTTGAERSYFKTWCRSETEFDNAQKTLMKYRAFVSFLNEFSKLSKSWVLLFAGALMIIGGSFTFGGMAVFQSLLSQLEQRMMKVVYMLDDYQQIKTNIERTDDMFERRSQEKVELREEPDKLQGNIEFKNVTFRYNKGDRPAIEDISFTLKRGDIVALVGHTGSGKSTILKLLSNLYAPESGQILIDGRPIEEIPDAILRASVSTVDQEITMYVDTVRNNLKLWDECIEDYEMILAARDAQIHPRIISSSGGYDETILEFGRNFSGGELQRLSLARALSADPTILILDEFTSALDVITENRVFDAIRKRNAGTCILAAHRLSTTMLCDRVLVIDKGKIVEDGKPQELYELGGKFRQLVDNG